MGFQCGIVGLPNVGKSTIFKALTATEVPAENYPFCTVDPNIGVVGVPDDRLHRLGEIYQPEELTPTVLEFLDIAGLVKGASRGEGLGNQFLAQIRQVDAIAHIVRCFEEENVSHVSGELDPVDDIQTVNTELYLKDLESVENRKEKLRTPARTGDKEAVKELGALEKAEEHLSLGKPVRTLSLEKEEQKFIADLFLLSAKPVLYVANISEEELISETSGVQTNQVREYAEETEADAISICGKLESDIAMLPENEKTEFLQEYGLQEPGLHKLIYTGYQLLHLITFFTCNPNEARAWTIRKGATAPEAAGKVHTDFQRGFIRAEVFKFEDLDRYGSEKALREHGLVHQEGRDYIVEDGDVIFFKHNV